MFCSICGKEAQLNENGLCEACSLKEQVLEDVLPAQVSKAQKAMEIVGLSLHDIETEPLLAEETVKPCLVCGTEGPVNTHGFCETCAAKLKSMPAATSSYRAMTGSINGQPIEMSESNTHATNSREVLQFGQSDKFRLRNPFSVTIDPWGNIMVMDRPVKGRYRIALFSPEGTYKRTFLECRQGHGPHELNHPKGVAIDLRGIVYIPDAGNNRIQTFDVQGTCLGAIGSSGEGHGQFTYPCDVEVDDIGILYVADTGNSRIQKLTPQGVPLLTIGWVGDDDDDEDDSQLDEPMGVTIDKYGHILVADTNHHRVVEYDTEGHEILAFGKEGKDLGQLSYPSDVRIGKDGTIYVADMDNYRVQTFDRKGTFLAAFALQGVSGGIGGGDVAVDEDGYLLICNTSAHTVVLVELFDSLPPSIER